MNATGGFAQLPRSWRRNVARCTVHVLLDEKVNCMIALSSYYKCTSPKYVKRESWSYSSHFLINISNVIVKMSLQSGLGRAGCCRNGTNVQRA